MRFNAISGLNRERIKNTRVKNGEWKRSKCFSAVDCCRIY
jgi:hypothetical protein